MGTVSTPTEGIYLTDISGNNSSKVLTPGKLKELGNFTVDTTAHTITEEFIVRNDSAGTNVTVIDACDVATGWNADLGTGHVITVDNGRIKVTGTTDATGLLLVNKAPNIDITGYSFLTCEIESSLTGHAYVGMGTNTVNFERWTSKPNVSTTANTILKCVLPFKAPISESGSSPNWIAGTPVWSSFNYLRVGYKGTASTPVTFYIDNITACNGTWAQVEVAVPDRLVSPNGSIFNVGMKTHNGSTYSASYPISWNYNGMYGSGVAAAVVVGSATVLDGTSLVHMYGLNSGGTAYGMGATVYPQGVSGQSPAYAASDWLARDAPALTYSLNSGTRKRLGFAFKLPPAGGLTGFNQVRLKLVTYYAADSEGHMGSTTHELSNDASASTGLHNLVKPWIALYDPTTSLIDFYLHSHRPQSLSFKRDETGTIHELSLYPGSGSIYHGQISFADLSLDSDSDLIPDCLEASVNGSITQFLKNYGMVI